jgi:PIN domain nuclease of toxin-antitoxin system
MDELFHELDTNPAFRIIPLTTEVAHEVAAMGDALRDPGDRVIVATARVHRLRLLTADQRIIESALVPVID